jgi:hypothetical protein
MKTVVRGIRPLSLLLATGLAAQETKTIPEPALPSQHALARDLLQELVTIAMTPTNGSTTAAEAMAAPATAQCTAKS